MAKKVVKGATGNVELTTSADVAINAKLTTIGVDMGQQIFDVTSFGDVQEYADYETGGMKALAGSAAGFIVYDDTNTNPFDMIDEVANIEITWGPGNTTTFGIIISDLQLGMARQGVGALSFNWVKADGDDPVVVWDEAGA
jgi:hypothetical protein